MTLRVLVRGGGDLASGAVLRCYRAGWEVCVTELPEPLAVRRTVSFSQAIYDGRIQIEGAQAVRVSNIDQVENSLRGNLIPVLVDPNCELITEYRPDVLVDARMSKQREGQLKETPELIIGLGPGFTVGINCDAVIETLRGHFLGRVIWEGSAEKNTGVPDRVGQYQTERVLRAPVDGRLQAFSSIGDHINAGQVVAAVEGQQVVSPIPGVLRGLIQDGVRVKSGVKVGDVDPRDNPVLCQYVSDKALAVGGGVMEAILSWPGLRSKLYGK